MTLPKIPGKEKNYGKIGRGILRRGDAVSLGIFSRCGVGNVTTVAFNTSWS